MLERPLRTNRLSKAGFADTQTVFYLFTHFFLTKAYFKTLRRRAFMFLATIGESNLLTLFSNDFLDSRISHIAVYPSRAN